MTLIKDTRPLRGSPQPVLLNPGIARFLRYRPPYDWRSMLSFLQARAIPGVETVAAQAYARVIEIGGAVGWIRVTCAPERAALCVTGYFPEPAALSRIEMRLRHLFDLDADPLVIGPALAKDAALAPLVARRPGLRLPGAWDGLEIGVRVILGQQISVRAATVLSGKLTATLGTKLSSLMDVPGLTHTFPAAHRLTPEAVARIGLPRTRAAAIAALASAAQSQPGFFDARGAPHEAIARFCALPGIGPWTAQTMALRVLHDPDAFPEADAALRRIGAVRAGCTGPAALLTRAERWRPWRAYAALHLWMSESNPSS